MAEDVDQTGMQNTVRVIIILFDAGGKVLEAMKAGRFFEQTSQHIEVIGVEFAGLLRLT